MSDQSKGYQEPTREEITACAQRLYEKQGRPQGKAMEHWLQAEAQLQAERQAQAGTATAKAAKPAPAANQRAPKERQATWPAQSTPRQTVPQN